MCLLFVACVESEYANSPDSRSFPPTGVPVFSVALDVQGRVVLHRRGGGEVVLPVRVEKLSQPLVEKVRFSRDGALLFVPIRKDSLVTAEPSFELAVWDVAAQRMRKHVSVDRRLLDDQARRR